MRVVETETRSEVISKWLETLVITHKSHGYKSEWVTTKRTSHFPEVPCRVLVRHEGLRFSFWKEKQKVDLFGEGCVWRHWVLLEGGYGHLLLEGKLHADTKWKANNVWVSQAKMVSRCI